MKFWLTFYLLTSPAATVGPFDTNAECEASFTQVLPSLCETAKQRPWSCGDIRHQCTLHVGRPKTPPKMEGS